MSELKIATLENRAHFAPGEELAGAVAWRLDKQPVSLELRLLWFTRGEGEEDAAVVETLRFDAPRQEETRTFRFALPESPYSFTGTVFSLVWALELVAKPTKESTRLEFTLAPDGQEIVLRSVAT